MVFVLGDDGFGIDLFVPKLPGIDAQLLAFCETYATAATWAEAATDAQ